MCFRRRRRASSACRPKAIRWSPGAATICLSTRRGCGRNRARPAGLAACGAFPDANGQSEVTIDALAKSFVLGLPVDVAIRVSGNGDAVIVDMRSASRYGRYDLGDNAARIVDFLAELDQEVAGQVARRRPNKASAPLIRPKRFIVSRKRRTALSLCFDAIPQESAARFPGKTVSHFSWNCSMWPVENAVDRRGAVGHDQAARHQILQMGKHGQAGRAMQTRIGVAIDRLDHRLDRPVAAPDPLQDRSLRASCDASSIRA